MKIQVCWRMGWILMVLRNRLPVAQEYVLIRRSSAENMILMLMILPMSPEGFQRDRLVKHWLSPRTVPSRAMCTTDLLSSNEIQLQPGKLLSSRLLIPSEVASSNCSSALKLSMSITCNSLLKSSSPSNTCHPSILRAFFLSRAVIVRSP